MGKGTIGGKIVLGGEKKYRDALKNIKSGQAELRSEMKLCASQFKEQGNGGDVRRVRGQCGSGRKTAKENR